MYEIVLQYPRAMYLLGICYEKGLGVGVDDAKAADLYARASHGRHPEAQHNLGVYFEWGFGGNVSHFQRYLLSSAILLSK